MNRYKRPYTRGRSKRYRRNHGRRSGILKGILMIFAAVLIVTAGYFAAGGIASLFQKKPEVSSGSDTSSDLKNESNDNTDKVKTQNKEVSGIYLPFDKISSAEAQSSFLALVKETKINAVVIDLKAEDGKLLYQSSLSEATAAAAVSETAIDMSALCSKLKSSGVYVIGRIVCFKDNFMPRTEPGRLMSVKNSEGSRRWDSYSWLNPYSNETKNYLLGIVREACAFGFNEIMLDEVKFPDSVYLASQLSYTDTANGISKKDALNSFINSAADIAHEKNVKLALSLPAVGAYTDKVNEESGQEFHLDSLKADFLCPYFQPALLRQATVYGTVSPDIFMNAETNPYEAVKAVTEQTIARIKSKNSKIILRPWIQDYSTATQKYSEIEVKTQITALSEGGAKGYLSYGASGIYTTAGYK